MNNLSFEQLNKLNELNQMYKHNQSLLLCEEILEDSKKCLYLTKQNTKLKPLIDLFEEYVKIKNQLENNKKLLSEKDFKSLVEEENFSLTKQLEVCETNLIIKLSGYYSEIDEIIIEIINIKNGENLGYLLKKAYTRFCRNNNYVVSESDSVLNISGSGCYEIFKKQIGKHTSIDDLQIVNVFVYKKVIKQFFNKNDGIKIDVFRSSGAGGQNINKLSTAIRATHIKTGIIVTCQDERTQHQNKERALTKLEEKVNNYYEKLFVNQKEEQKKSQLTFFENSKTVNKYDFLNDIVLGENNCKLTEFSDGKII